MSAHVVEIAEVGVGELPECGAPWVVRGAEQRPHGDSCVCGCGVEGEILQVADVVEGYEAAFREVLR